MRLNALTANGSVHRVTLDMPARQRQAEAPLPNQSNANYLLD
jgi:hypothetical protein